MQALREKLALDKQMGSEYITFQIGLPARHMNTGGIYRDDRCALDRASLLHALLSCWCGEIYLSDPAHCCMVIQGLHRALGTGG